MSAFPAARVIYSIIFFVLMMILVIVSRPSWIFDPETGAPRPFGFSDADRKSTLFSFGVVVVVASVLSLYTFSWIDLIYVARSGVADLSNALPYQSTYQYPGPRYDSHSTVPIFAQDYYHSQPIQPIQPPTIVPIRIY